MTTTNTNKVIDEAKRVIIKKEVNTETRSVVFSCPQHSLFREIKLDNLQESIRIQAALHGISQKVGDAAAIAVVNNPTIQDKWAAMMEVADRIEFEALWNKEGREVGAKEWNDTLAALVTWKGATDDSERIAKIHQWASVQGKEKVYALRDATPALLTEYVKIKSRKPVETVQVDTTDLDAI